MLRGLDFAALAEFVPAPGLRVDVIALGPNGEVWIVECKSCRVDFVPDRKWRATWPGATGSSGRSTPTFRSSCCPTDAGLILADAFDAEMQRWPEPAPLPGARRRALVQRFARTAAVRLGQITDPNSPAVRWHSDTAVK